MNPGKDALEVGMFRAGGFVLPAHVDVENWCIAFVGNATCWPRTAATGGRPSKIRINISKFCDSSWAAVSSEAGGPGLQDEKQAPLFLANATHHRIQSAVTELASEIGVGTVNAPKANSDIQQPLLNEKP